MLLLTFYYLSINAGQLELLRGMALFIELKS